MEKRHRNCLRVNSVSLLQDLDVEPVVVHLKAAKILTEENEDEIMEPKTTKRNHRHRLLNLLLTRGPNAFSAFIKALRDTEQGFLADILEQYLSTEGSPLQKSPDESWTFGQQEQRMNLENPESQGRKEMNQAVVERWSREYRHGANAPDIVSKLAGLSETGVITSGEREEILRGTGPADRFRRLCDILGTKKLDTIAEAARCLINEGLYEAGHKLFDYADKEKQARETSSKDDPVSETSL